MAGRLDGRCGLVTGAGSGIGAATARRLRQDGAQVLTADLRGEGDLLLDVPALAASISSSPAPVSALFARLPGTATTISSRSWRSMSPPSSG